MDQVLESHQLVQVFADAACSGALRTCHTRGIRYEKDQARCGAYLLMTGGVAEEAQSASDAVSGFQRTGSRNHLFGELPCDRRKTSPLVIPIVPPLLHYN